MADLVAGMLVRRQERQQQATLATLNDELRRKCR
jgi:hypothetical protein